MHLTGSLFPFNVGAGVVVDQYGDTNVVMLRTDSAIKLFDRISFVQRQIALNELGIFQPMSIGSDNKARFMSLSVPKHGFTKRKSGCTWSPKGKVLADVDEIDVFPWQKQMEQCPDALFASCFEQLFSTGNDIHDFTKTPEGLALFQKLFNRIYLGMGNDLTNMVWFANDPDISAVNTAGTYAVGADEWADYFDQMTSTEMRGLIPLIKNLRSTGDYDHLQLELNANQFNSDGEFTGDIIAVLKSLVKNATPDMQKWMTYGYIGADGMKRFPAIMLTSALFEAYEDYIEATFAHLKESYNFTLMREDGTGMLMPGVMRWKNMPVVKWDEYGTFDSITGTTTHAAAAFAPGVLGVPHDVQNLKTKEGIALRMIQRTDAPYNGKIFMDSYMKLGTGLADTDFVVYSQYRTLPA